MFPKTATIAPMRAPVPPIAMLPIEVPAAMTPRMRSASSSAEAHRPLGAPHRAARRLDVQRLGLRRRVADHERSTERRQREHEQRDVAAKVDGRAAEEEELDVAIDRRVEHLAGVGRRPCLTRDETVDGVGRRCDDRQERAEPEVPHRDGDAGRGGDGERAPRDRVRADAEPDARVADGLRAPVEHLHGALSEKSALAFTVDAGETRATLYGEADGVREDDQRDESDDRQRASDVHLVLTAAPRASARARAAPRGSSRDTRCGPRRTRS